MSIESDQLAQRVAGAVIEELLSLLGKDAHVNIQPYRAYTTLQVAGFLGMDTTDTEKARRNVRSIPLHQLPRTGGSGRPLMYLGLDLLRYISGLPPLSSAERKALFTPAAPPVIRSLNPTGSTRIV